MVTMQYLVFEHGRESYCISIDEVSEVLHSADVLALPRIPPEFDGIFQLRGRPVTLLNFAGCFLAGEAGTAAESEILIFAEPYQHFGIRVSGLIESRELEHEKLEVPSSDDNRVGAVVEGIIRDGETKIYNLLSADKIFQHARNLVAESGGKAL